MMYWHKIIQTIYTKEA